MRQHCSVELPKLFLSFCSEMAAMLGVGNKKMNKICPLSSGISQSSGINKKKKINELATQARLDLLFDCEH